MEYLKYNEHSGPVFTMMHLTGLMIIEEGTKRQKAIWKDQAVYMLLSEYLKLFGITIDGSTYLLNEDFSQTDIKIKHVTIDADNIPLDNLNILWKLCGWHNSKVDVNLKATDDFTLSAMLYTFDNTCELVKWCYMRKEVIGSFKTLKDLIIHFRNIDF